MYCISGEAVKETFLYFEERAAVELCFDENGDVIRRRDDVVASSNVSPL